ncbi:glycosyltransferase family 2 protein [Algoriella sp.]|uniref:glycosyltransferase family 2 protein n=1 Tax=Algoriella sp. TaxID=1872434 RepID=UPI002FC5FC82
MIKSQRKNPLSIPIIIINFNQLFYLKQLVDFLINRGFENIVIIDNLSTYPPLLEYYKIIESKVKVEYMGDNQGHKVFFESEMLQRKYGKGYYVLTDADIVPNEKLPIDFMEKMIKYLDKYFKRVTKVGFALKIDDIPNEFPLKDKVIKWESKYWENEVEANLYKTIIDTTFALYKPNYPNNFNFLDFFLGIRVGENFEAKHGGWYKNPLKMTEEDMFYQKTASSSSSWNFDGKGNEIGAIKY